MPTYDYACEACAHEFEHFQSMTDKHLRTCPKCKKRRLVRKIGAGAGLIFKGTGFYQTDYKSPSGGGSAPKEEKKSDAKEAEAPPAASESKPAPAAGPSEPSTKSSTVGKGAKVANEPAAPAPKRSSPSSRGGKA